MRKVGIVGGIAWLSTVDYYAEICRRSERAHADAGHSGSAPTPEMTIESLDITKAVSYIGVEGDEDSWVLFDAYHRRALQRIEASGAAFALIASNTPHHRFATIVRGIDIPVIDLFDVVAKEAAVAGVSQILILGTRLTMASARLRRAFETCGVEAAPPGQPQAREATIELIGRLQRGDTQGAAVRIERLAKAESRHSFDSPVVCLACTELMLAFPEYKTFSRFKASGVTYINSSAVHIDAAVRQSLAH